MEEIFISLKIKANKNISFKSGTIIDEENVIINSNNPKKFIKEIIEAIEDEIQI